MNCKVEGCNGKHRAKGFCGKHYARFSRNGDMNLRRRELGTGSINYYGYLVTRIDKESKRDHVRIAEKALGKELPKGAIVHHVDGDPANNSPWNLVVCPNQEYHGLLHKRQRAFEACGNANFVKCYFCKQYDDQKLMYVYNKRSDQVTYHRDCKKKYRALRKSGVE